ncbi:MAG TPA: alcohol dehydrogenase [Burkholderiaceae bacterium]|nr:alcohol dehydrogenase [Burkholderiaceae bacterium]
MRSMQVREFGGPLVETTTDTPQPQGHEVLLRVSAAGICHTDLHLWHGGYDLGGGRRLSLQERGVKLPLIMGHETVGVVVAVGDQVQGVKPGDVRLIYPWLGCGQCESCSRGQENYCLKPDTVGINRPGGYADHVLVPHERSLVPLRGLDPVRAAPLACSGLTCYSALKKFGLDRLREQVLVVFGAGGLGLMCLKLLAGIGGKGAVVIEPNAERAQAALDAGALAVIDPNAADAADQVLAAVGGPVHAVLDLVGNEHTATTAFNLLTKGGHLVTVGLFGGAANWPLPLLAIKALTIQGGYVGSLPELHELVELVAEKKLELIPVHTCGLSAIGDALRSLEAGQVVGRMVITP